ncbi:MAG: hypothetical protein OXB93_06380 [Cytophagales bacterium]|nr:hypothetical protein [Cytophagales bacterium]
MKEEKIWEYINRVEDETSKKIVDDGFLLTERNRSLGKTRFPRKQLKEIIEKEYRKHAETREEGGSNETQKT